MAVWWERYYPLLGAIVAGLGAYFIPGVSAALSGLSIDALSAGINMSSIFIGFMATMAGVILATSSKAVAFMKRVGKLEQLVAYIWSSILTSFVFLIVCTTILVLTNKGVPFILANQGWLWLSTCTWSILTTARATHITMILVRNSAKEE